MKFLCLGYLKPAVMDALPKEEIKTIMLACNSHLEQMYQSSQVLLDVGISPESKSLRRSNGKLDVKDGPLTETEEAIGSVFLIEASDMDEAIQIASLHPSVRIDAGERYGWRIEIRPIHYDWKQI